MSKLRTIIVLGFVALCGDGARAGTIAITYDAATRDESVIASDPSQVDILWGVNGMVTVAVLGNLVPPLSSLNFFIEVQNLGTFVQTARQDNTVFFDAFPGDCRAAIPHPCGHWDGTIESQEFANPNLHLGLTTFQFVNGDVDTVSFRVISTPEPSTGVLFLLALILLIAASFIGPMRSFWPSRKSWFEELR